MLRLVILNCLERFIENVRCSLSICQFSPSVLCILFSPSEIVVSLSSFLATFVIIEGLLEAHFANGKQKIIRHAIFERLPSSPQCHRILSTDHPHKNQNE